MQLSYAIGRPAASILVQSFGLESWRRGSSLARSRSTSICAHGAIIESFWPAHPSPGARRPLLPGCGRPMAISAGMNLNLPWENVRPTPRSCAGPQLGKIAAGTPSERDGAAANTRQPWPWALISQQCAEARLEDADKVSRFVLRKTGSAYGRPFPILSGWRSLVAWWAPCRELRSRWCDQPRWAPKQSGTLLLCADARHC